MSITQLAATSPPLSRECGIALTLMPYDMMQICSLAMTSEVAR